MQKHLQIRIKGIVQGVGFRPFVHRLAAKYNIKGYVLNDTEGVLVFAQAGETTLNAFVDEIKNNAPALAFIASVETKELAPAQYYGFAIEQSRDAQQRSAFIAPDAALCDECLAELRDPADRRHNYPFITCTNCGPRFSIVRDIPYDRRNTTMSEFSMCPQCAAEYADTLDRRFHTQPDACAVCGPALALHKNDGTLLSTDTNTIVWNVLELLADGGIVAIKSVGGYLIAADATLDSAVHELRERKNRPFKPFALMANLQKIKEFAHVDDAEEKLLLSKERPIILLKEKKKVVSRYIAPHLSYLGAMLPYAPLQHLLFDAAGPDMILIMTSGNVSDEPIIYKDSDAFAKLGTIADYIVSYNREIEAQTDDSVLLVEGGAPYMIRRSRGYVPVPLRSQPRSKHLLATGGDLKNSFALAKDDMIILSQFLGDIASPETNEVYKKTINHFKRIYALNPQCVVSDMHPGYFTSLFADELEQTGLQRIKVQHHHAHIASVMEEHGISDKVIGIAFDGTGYGTDGTLWGSEFLIADRIGFERAGHFSNFPLPGGESAIKDVWKIGLSLLYRCFGKNFPVMQKSAKTDMLIEIIDKKINSPETCSIGRIFDGVSAILGLSSSISTEAEAAMLLEEAAARVKTNILPYIIPFDTDTLVISTESLVEYIAFLLDKGESIDRIAFAFHCAIVQTGVRVAAALRERTSINRIALSGGVFQNRIILGLMKTLLKEEKFDILLPVNLPFNDGCIAVGQIAVAKELS